MELYPRHFEALGNGRQTSMERLNDILGRTSQRYQQDTEQQQNRSTQPQRPGMSLSRHPLHEQTAHQGPRSRYTQSQYHQNMPPHIHSEQDQAMPKGPRSAYPRQQLETNVPGSPISNQQHSQRQMNLANHSQYEDLGTVREHNWRSPRIAASDSVDSYSATSGADVREEWEDDTVEMRYGDWEDDGSEEYSQFRPQEPGTVASGRYLMSQRTGAGSPTSPRNKRSFVTRELHMTPASDSRLQTTRKPGNAHVQSKQLPPPQPVSQEVHRSVRMTQPLKPQPVIRANLDASQEDPHMQTPSPQLASREQLPSYNLINACPICKGAGYLRADVPYGHPSFGRPIACECKEAERKAKRRQQLQEMSDLGAFYDKSFANFNTRVAGVQEAFSCAYEFAQNPNGWLLLIGPNGCGKTHLAAAIANQSLDDGALVLFATVPDLLDHLRAAFAPTSNEIYDQLFARMREAEVLVLDDLGAQQSSPWANEKLFQLLNYRYNSRFPTVITANSRGLQSIDERIRSRLMDSSLVTTVILDRAKDFRPNNPRRT
jgi:DNA replication protein DnaC